jgi:glycosyltransferase involved in cell wall biosynthesis
MDIAIVMTYFERPFQLERTLNSIKNPTDINLTVIIVDDASPTPLKNTYKYDFETVIIRIDQKQKQWTSPEPVLNIGIRHAIKLGVDVIITQNAECYHVGDIIGHAATIDDSKYIAFGCFSINEKTTFSDHNIYQIISSNNFGAGCDGQNAWYNHPDHRPVGYDFCGVLTAKNMIKLNGFDERFSNGIGRGDVDYLRRIKLLGLSIEITAEPFVVHQWHYNGFGVPVNKPELIDRNRRLFCQLKTSPDTRAKHIYSNDFEIVET